jgi:hypothetical protein
MVPKDQINFSARRSKISHEELEAQAFQMFFRRSLAKRAAL